MKKNNKYLSVLCFLSVLISISSYATDNQNSDSKKWDWQCSIKQTSDLFKDKIIWKTLLCDGFVNHKKTLENLNINIVFAPLNDPEIKFVPYQAQSSNQLEKLPQIADHLNAKYNIIAGINGGYFYRMDVPGFTDNICYYKTFDPPKPGESIGDSLLQYNGKSYATNCAFMPGLAESSRAALILTGVDPVSLKTAPYITLVKPNTVYMQKDQIPDAIGAGPNLITDGKLTVNDPNENLLPTLEFSANSAVGIINDTDGYPAQIVFFVVDGNNNSAENDWPAMNAYQMADFMLNYLKVSNAMSMDQGGSTTLYVSASDLSLYPMHVVSNSHFEPGVPPSANYIRDIYDGLFITTPKEKI